MDLDKNSREFLKHYSDFSKALDRTVSGGNIRKNPLCEKVDCVLSTIFEA